jgi:hypothetical protein
VDRREKEISISKIMPKDSKWKTNNLRLENSDYS